MKRGHVTPAGENRPTVYAPAVEIAGLFEALADKAGPLPSTGMAGAAKPPRPRFGRVGKAGVRGRGLTQPKRDGSMNSLERRFATELDALLAAGRIARWDFEPEKLRLADDTYYTPDFRVLLLDGAVERIEVKGTWAGNEHNRVKLKVAAEMHPYVFVAAMRPSAKKLAKAKVTADKWAFEVFGGESGVVAAFLASGSGELFDAAEATP